MLPAKAAASVSEALCTLLVIGLQSLFLPTSTREPCALPWFLDLCVYTVSPSVLCFPLSYQILLIPTRSLSASCQLPEDIRTLLALPLHATLPARHLTVFLHIYVCNFYVPTYAVFSKLEKLWSHKTFIMSFNFHPSPFLNARLLTPEELVASVPVLVHRRSGRKLGFPYL